MVAHTWMGLHGWCSSHPWTTVWTCLLSPSRDKTNIISRWCNHPRASIWRQLGGDHRFTKADKTSRAYLGSDKRNPTKNRMGEEGENSRPALSDMGTTSHMGLPNTWR